MGFMILKSEEFRPIPGFKRYGVSKLGVVIELSSQTMMSPTGHHRGYLAVELLPDGSNRRTIKPFLAKLVLLTYDPLPPALQRQYVGVNYKNGDVADVRLENLEWDKGIYTPPHMPGISLPITAFIRVPGYVDVEIDLFGTVKQAGSILPQLCSSNEGYYTVSVRGENRTATIPIHRLLALAFLEHPIDTSELVVNHKNGIVTDNQLDNLEWTTYSGNIYHAHRHGLRTDARPILVMEIETRTVSQYHNLGDFCRTLQIDDGTLWWRLRNGSPIRPYQGYYVKYENDLREWPEPDATFGRKTDEGVVVVATNLETNEVLEYESINACAKFFGKSSGSLTYQVRKSIPTQYNGYIVRAKAA